MIKKLLAAVLIWFCVFGNAGFAQKENYVWYFGDSAGIDFNSGTPVALTNSAMYQWEGSSSISDVNGNLLFYTSGLTVWDRNHDVMPNGTGLAGGFSSTQSALIVPFPGNSSLYYIFTVQQWDSFPNNFSYSLIDMSLNSGNGDITIKNNLIKSYATEKLTAVKHFNGNDIWVMIHGYGNDSLFAYLITASGISSTPVTSKIGPIIPSNNAGAGYMKFSPDGNKLAFAELLTNYVYLFDFNSTTGNVTNEKYLVLPGGGPSYGVEFSVNGNFLYTSMLSLGTFQWDITSNDTSTINATFQQIGTSISNAIGSMQLGPDGKIYVGVPGLPYLGVINNPDSNGLACNYVDTAVSLAGKNFLLALPNFITSYFLPTGINTNNPQQNQLTISPNPATDKITISFAATTSENITVKIYSITGEVIFEQKNKSATPITNYQIPIFNLTNGIYFLSVQTEREKVTKKMVVNH